jgi:hypothetical protein
MYSYRLNIPVQACVTFAEVLFGRDRTPTKNCPYARRICLKNKSTNRMLLLEIYLLDVLLDSYAYHLCRWNSPIFQYTNEVDCQISFLLLLGKFPYFLNTISKVKLIQNYEVFLILIRMTHQIVICFCLFDSLNKM